MFYSVALVAIAEQKNADLLAWKNPCLRLPLYVDVNIRNNATGCKCPRGKRDEGQQASHRRLTTIIENLNS
jgi:hypothetical protein